MSLTLDVRSPVKGVWHLGLVKDETIALGSWEPSLENTPELDRRLENFLWRGMVREMSGTGLSRFRYK